jgi:hypothetical protein
MEAINGRAAPPYEDVDLFTIDRPLRGAVATYGAVEALAAAPALAAARAGIPRFG